jgi:cobalt-zinc-cadmium efflux system outer membrane protein
MLRCILLFMLALAVPGLRAETFTVEGAVARALRANPDLAAARWSIEEARGRLWQSGRLPNPELETELKPNVRGREFSFSAGFMQKYPLTKRLFIERVISEAGVKAAEAEVRNAERMLKAEVRTAAVKLQGLAGVRALKELQRKNSLSVAEVATRIAQVGEGSNLKAAQLELEAQQLSLDLLQVEAERVALIGTLRPLLGLKSGTAISISGDLPAPSGSGSGTPSVDQRPDYQLAGAKEEAARAGIDLARAGKWDDATYGLTAEFERMEDAPEGLENDGFIGFKFSLPLPFWNKNEGKVHEAAAAAAKAGREKEALALRIRAEATAARAEMAVAAKIIGETSGPLLNKARELEELNMSANKLGQASVTDVLRSRERRFALETARLNALRDYHLARVRLMAAQGR